MARNEVVFLRVIARLPAKIFKLHFQSAIFGNTCYRYGSIRGWTVNYTYMSERPSVLAFVEDKDLYDAFLYWQGDKSKRPFPRKELNKHWHIEYQQ